MNEKICKPKSLIFCAFAYDNDMFSGENVKNISDKFNMYMKNVLVSLISAKKYNSNCDVALVSNVDIPEPYKSNLYHNGIIIYKEDFDRFLFDNSYKWCLAFYKLCALSKIIDKDYESYLLLDTDTFVQSNLDDLWEETKYNVMLYDINHRLSIENCEKFNNEVKKFCGLDRPVTNYGGEFIAGNRELLKLFIKNCYEIFESIKEKGFQTNFGDEFIVCLAADRMRDYVKNAGGYVYRFWTGYFRLVSTCHKYNSISIIHVPVEKNRGMIKIYKYISKYKRLPKNKKVYKMLNLEKRTFKCMLKNVIKEFLKRS